MNIEQLDKLQATLEQMKQDLHLLTVQLEALKYVKNTHGSTTVEGKYKHTDLRKTARR
jgi:hypothetical protein